MADIIDIEITTEKIAAGIMIIHIKGNLDGGTFGQLDRTFDNFCKQGIYKFIIDLTNLDYVSSAGAGVLLGWFGTLQEKQGNLIIVKPQPKVKSVFDMVGLSKCIAIAQERNVALKIISQISTQS